MYGIYGVSTDGGNIAKPETKISFTRPGYVVASLMAACAPILWPIIWADLVMVCVRIRLAMCSTEESMEKGVIWVDLPWLGRSGIRMW